MPTEKERHDCMEQGWASGSRKGRQEGLLLASAVFPRLSALPRMRKRYCPSTCSPRQDLPHWATARLQFKEAGDQGPFREDGGFLRKRMQMREERDLLIHVMSVELSMTN